MDIPHLVVQLVVAIVCASLANMLVPRRIPGKFVGLMLIGLIGALVGEWGYTELFREFGISYGFLRWQVQGVLIVPAIIGSAVVLYLVTAFLKWGRYGG